MGILTTTHLKTSFQIWNQVYHRNINKINQKALKTPSCWLLHFVLAKYDVIICNTYQWLFLYLWVYLTPTRTVVDHRRLLQRQQELRTLRSEVAMSRGLSDSVGFHAGRWSCFGENGGLFVKKMSWANLLSVNKQKMKIRMGVPKKKLNIIVNPHVCGPNFFNNWRRFFRIWHLTSHFLVVLYSSGDLRRLRGLVFALRMVNRLVAPDPNYSQWIGTRTAIHQKMLSIIKSNKYKSQNLKFWMS